MIEPDSGAPAGAGRIVARAGVERAPDRAPRLPRIRREPSDVAAEEREQSLGQRAVTVWLTGLPGSGKSSIARGVERALHGHGRHAYVLDGDMLRWGLNRDLGFARADRAENARRTAEVARLLNEAGLIVVVALISPFREDREEARTIVGPARFLEVHVSTPVEVCEQRDWKGVYRKARTGEIEEFTGISAPYELPERPELVLDGGQRALSDCVAALVELVAERARPAPK